MVGAVFHFQPDQYWTGAVLGFGALLSINPGAMSRRDQFEKLMLQQFSWQQFLVAIGALALLWYVVVVLVFYRRQMMGLLSGSGWKAGGLSRDEVLPQRWNKRVEPLAQDAGVDGEDPADSLMGKSRMPEGMSTVSMDQLSFAGVSDSDVEDQQGLVPDVLEDIKKVFGILVKEDGNKRDFFRLMESVAAAYPGLSAHPALRRINAYISDHASFHLTAEELEHLWN